MNITMTNSNTFSINLIVQTLNQNLSRMTADPCNHHHREHDPVAALQYSVRKADDEHAL